MYYKKNFGLVQMKAIKSIFTGLSLKGGLFPLDIVNMKYCPISVEVERSFS